MELTGGTFRDALALALRANAAHGRRRTNEDKRKAVEKALLRPGWNQKSDREVAGLCTVHHQMVSKVRAVLVKNGMVDDSSTRIGRDGVEQPARKTKATPANASYAPYKASATKPAPKPAAPSPPPATAPPAAPVAPLEPGYDDGAFSDDHPGSAPAGEQPWDADDRWHAERRAWESADAAWGRVVPDAADDPHLKVADTPAPYWTGGDVARLFGLPRSVVAALAPAAVAGDTAATRQHGASPGEPLYAAERVAVALTLLGELRRRRAAA